MTYRRNYADMIRERKHKYGDKFSDSSLAQQFVRYFESGDRIEVTTDYGDGETYVRRGTVGVTTGWVPSFLLMGRVSDHGSSDLLRANDRVTAVIRNSKRYPLAA